MVRAGHGHGAGQGCGSSVAPEEHQHVHTSLHMHAPHGAEALMVLLRQRRIVIAQVLEIGIVIHSFIIGIGLVSGPTPSHFL